MSLSSLSAVGKHRGCGGRHVIEEMLDPCGIEWPDTSPTFHFERSVGISVPDKEFHDDASHDMAQLHVGDCSVGVDNARGLRTSPLAWSPRNRSYAARLLFTARERLAVPDVLGLMLLVTLLEN